MTILTREEQLENAKSSIKVIEKGIEILFKEANELKKFLPIRVIEEGKQISVNEEHPEKAESAIFFN